MATLIERRQFGRRSVYKPAIVVQEGFEDISCRVVDISGGGARIQSDRANEFQQTLRLLLPEDDIYYDCRLVHRQLNSVGVEFVTMSRRISKLKEREARRTAELARAGADSHKLPE